MWNNPQRMYATVWRWHFYAGLFVAPFLIVLSLTGMIYLFDTEINDALHPELRFTSSTGRSLPPSRLIAAVESAYPGGTVTRMDTPAEAGRTVEMFVTTTEGEALRVFVNPANATVLGAHVYTETLVGFADVTHGSLMLGDIGDAVVELAASWTFILVCSGLYLWFPGARRAGGTWLPRLGTRGRGLWRELHRFTGLYTAVLIVFLIVSGLPWATVWGGKVLAPLTNTLGLGYPEDARRATQSSVPTAADADEGVPWTLRLAPMPESDAQGGCFPRPEGHGGSSCLPAQGIGVDGAARILAAAGMTEPYRLSLPHEEAGVFMAYTYPDRPQGQRTIQIDRYSGTILADIRFGDYGAVAKAVEIGVALHMGNYFGRTNQIVLLLPCLGSIALVATGAVMWWKRRPKGRLGAPPRPAGRSFGPGLWIVIGSLAIAFPLAGLSMISVWAGDRTLQRLRRGAATTTR